MIEETFEKQDAFTAAMIAAFDAGTIPEVFKPYMDWKKGVSDLPKKQQAYEMLDAIEKTDTPCEYLMAIGDELSGMIQILR